MADVYDDKDVKGSPTLEKRDSGEQGVTILDSQPPVAQERTLRRDLNSRQISMIAIGGVRRPSWEGADGSGGRHRSHHRSDIASLRPSDLSQAQARRSLAVDRWACCWRCVARSKRSNSFLVVITGPNPLISPVQHHGYRLLPDYVCSGRNGDPQCVLRSFSPLTRVSSASQGSAGFPGIY